MLILALSACAAQIDMKPRVGQPALDSEPVSLELASQLVGRGQLTEAITAFRRLLRKGGPSIPVLNGLGIAHAELGRPDLAADYFAKALMVSPDDPTTLNNIGYAALRREEVALARLYLEKAKRGGNRSPEVDGNLLILDRLEAWLAAEAGSADPTIDATNKSFKVQRKNATTVDLVDFRREQDSQAEIRRKMPPPLETVLIDFSELFDPWKVNNRINKPPF